MTRASVVTVPRFDPLAPEVLLDPYPTYARLRAGGRLCRMGPGSWGVTQHADVAALLRDPRLGNTFPQDDPQFRMPEGLASDVFQRIMPTLGPEQHGKLHHLMARAFRPSVARAIRERITALVDELLAPALDTGRLDASADLAFPLAATVVCELIGIPVRARAEIWPRVAELGRAFTPFLPDTERSGTGDALVWFRGYVRDLLAETRPDPDGNLLAQLLATESDREEIVDNVAFLCFTGFETTMNMVCTGAVALSTAPGEWARLRAQPELATSATEEFVRFDAPIQYTARLALEPIPIGDRVIRTGRSVFLLLGCANHDERVFAAPERVDIGRTPNPHVGFGGGVRGCLGAALARVEGGTAFARVAARLASIAPGGPPVREPNALFRSHASIPLAVVPA